MKCQQCDSEQLYRFGAKVSDGFWFHPPGQRAQRGYVPPSSPLYDLQWGKDYLLGTLCLECGQLQGQFPVEALELPEPDENYSPADSRQS